MADKQTPKSPWRSRYGGGFLSDGQFLAESMCARKARHEKRDLPLGFWELPKWKKLFLMQLNAANKLLKTYSAGTIIRALRRPDAKNIYSLTAKFLLPIIQEQHELEIKQEEVKREAQRETQRETQGADEKKKDERETGGDREATRSKEISPRPPFIKQPSLLSKLREIDDAD